MSGLVVWLCVLKVPASAWCVRVVVSCVVCGLCRGVWRSVVRWFVVYVCVCVRVVFVLLVWVLVCVVCACCVCVGVCVLVFVCGCLCVVCVLLWCGTLKNPVCAFRTSP